jgi:signal transduction histidine kinase
MSASAAAERPQRQAVVAGLPRFTAGTIVALGGTLLLLATGLTILVAVHDIPNAGHPAPWKLLIRLGAMGALMPLGALMLARLPRNPISLIVFATSTGVTFAVAAQEYATYSHFVARLPAGSWIGWIGEWAGTPMIALVSIVPLLFPSGRLPSRRWRPALWLGVAATSLLWLQQVLGPGDELKFLGNPISNNHVLSGLSDAGGLGWFLMLPAAGAGIAALIVRGRTAGPEMREQLRLLRRAAVVVTLAFVACLVGSFAAPHGLDIGATAFWLSLSFLAGTIAIAILRHQLFGLDVYVNRALVYAALTLVLGALYVLAVLGFGRLLGQQVNLGVALPATALVAVAFQPLRGWLQQSVNRLLHGQRDEPYAAISTLGRRLGQAMDSSEVLPTMVETIAGALRLPYVAVELTGAGDEPAAAHGTPAAGIALRLPLIHSGERIGTLVVGARAHGEALGDADRRLLGDFAHHAAAAARAVALTGELQRSREQLVTTREEERRRLSGDLHDGLGPTLAGALLTIEAARESLARNPAGVDLLLDRAAASIESTVADVRRLVYGLRPPVLDQLGLVGALRQQMSALSSGADGQFTCDVDAPDPMPPLPAAAEVAAFRIAQEALTNVARHANARTASVRIAVDESLHLEIRDDGRGLPTDRRHAGVGLTSMHERTAELGGSFALSSSPNGGTVVSVQLPLA